MSREIFFYAGISVDMNGKYNRYASADSERPYMEDSIRQHGDNVLFCFLRADHAVQMDHALDDALKQKES
jgi:hypothetical protein